MTTHAVPPTATRSRQQLDRRAQYRRRARRADLLVTLLWASGAVAAALFLSVGGAGQFQTLSDTITSLGIVAGLVGSDFILVMLILAARVPFIDRAIGHDRAMAVHRQLGKPALYLLLGHAALLLMGYGVSQGVNVVTWVIDMWSLPDMPLAFLGLGLLLLVVYTSLVAVRKKFSYEGWHLVHLLSYVAVAVAIPHQLSNGQILTGGSLQRAYWIALYVVAFGSIIVYRFAEPLISSIRHSVRVAMVEEVAPGVVSIYLTGRNLGELGSAGGQFFVWRFWTAKTWWHAHPISLSAAPTSRSARITIRDLGAGSARISQVPIGTRVWFEGPYGLFSDAGRTAPKLAILAAGIGITPARALLESSRLTAGEATIALRATDDSQTYLWDEVRDIASRKHAQLYALVGQRGRRNANWLPESDRTRGVTLQSIFPDLLESDLYICGPSAWLDSVEADARAAGLPEHQLHSERFDW
jgi:predicted ferric reductase